MLLNWFKNNMKLHLLGEKVYFLVDFLHILNQLHVNMDWAMTATKKPIYFLPNI
jgi:hypothetical protein